MTEQEWRECTNPRGMWAYVVARGPLNERKLRLFAVACCRGIWSLLSQEADRQAVEAVEQHLEGKQVPFFWWGTFMPPTSPDRKKRQAVMAARFTTYNRPLIAAQNAALYAAEAAAEEAASAAGLADRVGPGPRHKAAFAAWDSVWNAPITEGTYTMALRQQAWTAAHDAARAEEGARQAALLRDIFSFHSQRIARPVLLWNDGLIVKLARAAYEERHLPSGFLDNSRLAILGDALEESGCDNADVIGHLRGPGPHVRGCFVVDHLVGKS